MIFKCFNNNSGICMWQKNKGEECGDICERYNKCFSCAVFGTCERIKEDFPNCENMSYEELSDIVGGFGDFLIQERKAMEVFEPEIEEDDDLLDTWEE